ncbi:MAG: tryptophan synthase subunit alpha [Microbacteriaceae bacterium]
MTSVAETIQRAKAEGRGVLVGYLPAGYPTLDGSVDALVALAEAGADVLELGVPYSDPVMDGIVIQKATNESLEGGFRVRDVFTIVRAVREKIEVPILVMTYWNPVVQYGVDRFAGELKAAGGAGLITPDLIPDEAGEWIRASDDHGLERVFLAAPSSTDERLRSAVVNSTGFVYAVSTMGITGARGDIDTAAKTLVSRLRSVGADSVCVGLGISTPDQVSDVCSYADGAIVGSHLVSALGYGGVDAVRSATVLLAQGISTQTA